MRECDQMAKDYQRKTNNPYLLPKTVYNRVLWLIRDYERMKAERNEIVHGYNCVQDGLPRGNEMGNPTMDRAIKLEMLGREMEAVEQALLLVDEDLRNGVMNNICYQVSYPFFPSIRTWGRARSKFIHKVAENLKLV